MAIMGQQKKRGVEHPDCPGLLGFTVRFLFAGLVHVGRPRTPAQGTSMVEN